MCHLLYNLQRNIRNRFTNYCTCSAIFFVMYANYITEYNIITQHHELHTLNLLHSIYVKVLKTTKFISTIMKKISICYYQFTFVVCVMHKK